MKKKVFELTPANYQMVRTLFVENKSQPGSVQLRKAMGLSTLVVTRIRKNETFEDYQTAVEAERKIWAERNRIKRGTVEQPVVTEPVMDSENTTSATPNLDRLEELSGKIAELTNQVEKLSSEMAKLTSSNELEREIAEMLIAKGAVLEVDDDTRDNVINKIKTFWG